MSGIHIAECRVNGHVIVQYVYADGFYKYEVYMDDGTPLGWYESLKEAEEVTR